MKLMTLGLAAVLATGSIGLAHATALNLVTNGGLDQITNGKTAPTQFGSRHGTASGCAWGHQFISNWKGNSGYEIWYPNAQAASTVSACTQWGNAATQRLPTLVTAPPIVTDAFVGLDGSENIRGGISQTINNLVAGDRYTVQFWWASTQEMSRTGPTTEQIQVSLGGQTFLTPANNIGTRGWSGWTPVSFTFTADSTSEILNFLSIGTPGSYPPFAVLTGISMYQVVPEPPVLGLFGGGLLGLGLLAFTTRRRALRRSGAIA